MGGRVSPPKTVLLINMIPSLPPHPTPPHPQRTTPFTASSLANDRDMFLRLQLLFKTLHPAELCTFFLAPSDAEASIAAFMEADKLRGVTSVTVGEDSDIVLFHRLDLLRLSRAPQKPLSLALCPWDRSVVAFSNKERTRTGAKQLQNLDYATVRTWLVCLLSNADRFFKSPTRKTPSGEPDDDGAPRGTSRFELHVAGCGFALASEIVDLLFSTLELHPNDALPKVLERMLTEKATALSLSHPPVTPPLAPFGAGYAVPPQAPPTAPGGASASASVVSGYSARTAPTSTGSEPPFRAASPVVAPSSSASTSGLVSPAPAVSSSRVVPARVSAAGAAPSTASGSGSPRPTPSPPTPRGAAPPAPPSPPPINHPIGEIKWQQLPRFPSPYELHRVLLGGGADGGTIIDGWMVAYWSALCLMRVLSPGKKSEVNRIFAIPAWQLQAALRATLNPPVFVDVHTLEEYGVLDVPRELLQSGQVVVMAGEHFWGDAVVADVYRSAQDAVTRAGGKVDQRCETPGCRGWCTWAPPGEPPSRCGDHALPGWVGPGDGADCRRALLAPRESTLFTRSSFILNEVAKAITTHGRGVTEAQLLEAVAVGAEVGKLNDDELKYAVYWTTKGGMGYNTALGKVDGRHVLIAPDGTPLYEWRDAINKAVAEAITKRGAQITDEALLVEIAGAAGVGKLDDDQRRHAVYWLHGGTGYAHALRAADGRRKLLVPPTDPVAMNRKSLTAAVGDLMKSGKPITAASLYEAAEGVLRAARVPNPVLDDVQQTAVCKFWGSKSGVGYDHAFKRAEGKSVFDAPDGPLWGAQEAIQLAVVAHFRQLYDRGARKIPDLFLPQLIEIVRGAVPELGDRELTQGETKCLNYWLPSGTGRGHAWRAAQPKVEGKRRAERKAESDSDA